MPFLRRMDAALSNLLVFISPNVPAVCDVFLCAIKETAGFQRTKKCAGEKHHKGRRPTGVFRRPSPLLRAQRMQACYTKGPPLHQFYYYLCFHNYFYNIIYMHYILYTIFKVFLPSLKTTVRHGWRTVWESGSFISNFLWLYVSLQKKCGGVWGAAPVPAVIAVLCSFTE
jgi:hypothetical protein